MFQLKTRVLLMKISDSSEEDLIKRDEKLRYKTKGE
jgi:hypothetical protein